MKEIKIIQIQLIHNVAYGGLGIYGLGEDNKMYGYSAEKEKWIKVTHYEANSKKSKE